MSGKLRSYLDRRVAIMLVLGFSSGLPLLLVLGTFSARLAFSDIDIKTIGLFSYLALPYSLKFLWSPVIDKLDPPLLARLIGRRRAWMVIAQCAVAASLALMAFANPQDHLALLGLGAFLVAFSAATQDVVIDGWRIDAAGTEMQGVMAATSNLGYRIALITAGAGALLLANGAGWTAAYLTMAGLMGIGIVAALLAPRLDPHVPASVPHPGDLCVEPEVHSLERQDDRMCGSSLARETLSPRGRGQGEGEARYPEKALPPHPVGCADSTSPPRGEGSARLGHMRSASSSVRNPQDPRKGLEDEVAGGSPAPAPWSFGRAIVAPLADLHRRLGSRLWAILVMVALYRMPDFVSGVMANPLYRTVGYSLPEIAAVTKLYGIWVGIFGSFAAGWAIARFGLYRVFGVGAALGAASHLSLAWLALHGPDLWTVVLPGGMAVTVPWRLAVAISVDNFGGGFAGTALIAYMSGLTGIGFAATQYALLSSLYALPGKLVAGSAGFVVAAYGFPTFFALTAAIGIPVVALCAVAARPGRPPVRTGGDADAEIAAVRAG